MMADKHRMSENQVLQVAQCTKIIEGDATSKDPMKYLISIKQSAKFVVGLGDRVAPTDIEEGNLIDFLLLNQIISLSTHHCPILLYSQLGFLRYACWRR